MTPPPQSNQDQKAKQEPREVMTEEQADAFQQWDKLDGATAWHLIERHADDWHQVGMMMEAWLRANSLPAVSVVPGEKVLNREPSGDIAAGPASRVHGRSVRRMTNAFINDWVRPRVRIDPDKEKAARDLDERIWGAREGAK